MVVAVPSSATTRPEGSCWVNDQPFFAALSLVLVTVRVRVLFAEAVGDGG